MKNVSIIIPTYNGALFIEEQIKSILSELIEGDKIICLDDCSTDNTLEVLHYLRNKSTYIEIFSNNKNIGPNKCILKLLSLVDTDLVAFADQDDIWIQGRLDLVRKSGSNSIILCGYLAYDEKSKKIIKLFKPTMPTIFKTLIKNSYPGCTFSGDTEVFKKLYNNNIVTMYDHYIIVRALLNNINIIIDDIYIRYRRHDNNVTEIGFMPNGILLALYRRVILLKDLIKSI
jgi:glycosyltransferase involved in cell wall biosynthesis